jgi:hypothetical protein
MTSQGDRLHLDTGATYRDQMLRHIADLSNDSFEGHVSRAARFGQFRTAVELAAPTVTDVLARMNSELLMGTGTIDRDPPPNDDTGQHVSRWMLSWPLQRSANHRRTGDPLEPVVIAAAFPPGFTHPHLGESKPVDADTVWAWPFQVTEPADASSLRFVFEAIALASLHERVFQADIGWRVLPTI